MNVTNWTNKGWGLAHHEVAEVDMHRVGGHLEIHIDLRTTKGKRLQVVLSAAEALRLAYRLTALAAASIDEYLLEARRHGGSYWRSRRRAKFVGAVQSAADLDSMEERQDHG